MPLTIWRPRGYVDGFSYDGDLPINGEPLPAPFDRDTKVREITRFTGSKTTHFCDTGEFAITTDQAQPDDVKKGYMVEVDGDHFVIEDVVWRRGDGGYSCTISGRDFWKYPESQIAHRWIGKSFGITGDDDVFTGETLAYAVSDWFTRMAAGWWRDRLRFPRAENNTSRQYWSNVVSFELEGTTQEAVLAKQTSAVCNEIMSYASEWRMFCNWFGLGLKWRFSFNDAAGVFEIEPILYDGKDSGIVLNTSSRGVSDFEYQENTRGVVNAAYCSYESYMTYTQPNANDYIHDDFSVRTAFDNPDSSPDSLYRSGYSYIDDGAASFSERAQFFSERYIDEGQPQDFGYNSIDGLTKWLKAQTEGVTVGGEKSFSFKYDGRGVYKYGENFNLGDYLTIVDDYLGIESKQRLTGVKTVYNAGDFKRYELEFNDQRIRQADILKRRFSEINRRTYGAGKRA